VLSRIKIKGKKSQGIGGDAKKTPHGYGHHPNRSTGKEEKGVKGGKASCLGG